MGKTLEVAADRAFDQTKTVLPAEVARGIYMRNAPSLAALKLMHLMIASAAGFMADDTQHQVLLSEIRKINGMKHHDRASLIPLFEELRAAVLTHDDPAKMRVIIGGLLDEAVIDYRHEVSGDLLVSWYFARTFRRMVLESNHWAVIDRQTVFHLSSKYSVLLFQHIASLVGLDRIETKTFTIEALRELLGIPTGKLDRFADLNRRAIIPSIAEINRLSRLNLTATPNKIGRTVASITIGWQVKAEPTVTKKRPDEKTTQKSNTQATFPASGSIEYDTHWRDLKRAAGCNMDNLLIANKFRAWCTDKSISLKSKNIEQAFSAFCRKIGRV